MSYDDAQTLCLAGDATCYKLTIGPASASARKYTGRGEAGGHEG